MGILKLAHNTRASNTGPRNVKAPPWARSNFYALETSFMGLIPLPVHCSRVQMYLARFLLSALGMSAN